MENGIDPLEEFHARILALERLEGLQAFPWYATALELVFRLIYREKLEPRKITIHRDPQNIADKWNGVVKKEDRFSLGISILPYFATLEYAPEMKRDTESILRVAREMEAEKWLEIKRVIEAYTNATPYFTFRALRLVEMEKPSRMKKPSPPPPREPRRKRKN